MLPTYSLFMYIYVHITISRIKITHTSFSSTDFNKIVIRDLKVFIILIKNSLGILSKEKSISVEEIVKY